MGRFDSTKTAIDVNITQNGNQEITGSILNSVLNNMVDATDAQLDILQEAIPTKLSDLEQDIPIGSYDDTEIRQELTELSAENYIFQKEGSATIGSNAIASIPYVTSSKIRLIIDAQDSTIYNIYIYYTEGGMLQVATAVNANNYALVIEPTKEIKSIGISISKVGTQGVKYTISIPNTEQIAENAEQIRLLANGQYYIKESSSVLFKNGTATFQCKTSIKTKIMLDAKDLSLYAIYVYYADGTNERVATNINSAQYELIIEPTKEVSLIGVTASGSSGKSLEYTIGISTTEQIVANVEQIATNTEQIATNTEQIAENAEQIEGVKQDFYAGYYDAKNLTILAGLGRDGELEQAVTIKASEFLPIPPSASILSYRLVTNNTIICFYDSSKNFMDSIRVSDTMQLTDGKIMLSQYGGAAYFRFNCKIDFMDDCYVKLLKGNSGSSGGGSGESESLSATNYGAIGDGISDDTEALEALFNAAYEQQRPIYIPKGTYMIRRSLPIKSNLHIYGEGQNSVIKKFPAVWSKVTQDISEGDTTIYVESTDGFVVGSQMFITYGTNKTGVAARFCSIGIIEEVNKTDNTIKFRSSYEGIKSGAVKSQEKGCWVSTSHAILRSWSMFSAAINVKIHDITLDGNRQEGEPMEWFNAPIHFDPDDKVVNCGIEYKYASYNHHIHDCYCVNSSYDGISEQGSSDCLIDNVAITNSAMHGIHFGTIFTNGKVFNCNIDGNGESGAAIFFCAGVKNIIVSGNMITNYYRGASDEEYADKGTDAIISGNILDNITDIAFNFVQANEQNIGGRHIVTNNLLRNIGSLFKGDHLRNVTIANNVIEGAMTDNPLIAITQSEYVSIVGNVWNDTMANPIDIADSEKIVNANNTWNL